MEISRDELKLISSESIKLRAQIEEGNADENDLGEKHSDILTILEDANKTIEKLRKENEKMNHNKSLMIEKNKSLKNRLKSMNVDFGEKLKLKDQMLESETESMKRIKIEMNENTELIKTLKYDNTKTLQKYADIVTELDGTNQVVEKLRNTNEKTNEEKHSMIDDLQTQKLIYEILENTFESMKEDCEKRLKERDEMLENERDSKKIMKNDLEDRKKFIKTLEVKNKSILKCMTESSERLSQLQEELQKSQKNLEKSFQEIHLRDLTIQKLNDTKRLEKSIS